MNIALIGNPNCGKTTLFNLLTGARQRVGNWPGVTVERKSGIFTYQKKNYHVIDLPGTYELASSDSSTSQDEQITREFILNEPDNVIINIIDATNLQRSLYLTFQLLDLKLPVIIVLNMIDAVTEMGEHIDEQHLTELLGCPVIAISATKKTGIDLLYTQIEKMMANPQPAKPEISTLGEQQEHIINRYFPEFEAHQINRWQFIVMLLNHDLLPTLSTQQQQQLEACRVELSAWCNNEIDIAIASARYDVIDKISRNIIKKPREASITLTDKLDKIALGRLTGIPFFLLSMYLMFIIAIKFGSVFIDFFDKLFATIFVDGLTHLLEEVNVPDWLTVILTNGIGTGIQTVATFIPVIAAMFFCLSFLEDSGYLARAAVVVDRGMRMIGLPGKAFVPMLVGFGCGVPAIMGTRTLESTRDRIMSICMIPFMSCGARLPVYALFSVIFFPRQASTVVFILYILGILVAVTTGIVLKFTLLKGKTTPFIMEMPVYRIPMLHSLLSLTWQRLKVFILRAGKAIVIMVTVLSILNSWGTDGSFGHDDSDHSILSSLSKKALPAFEPMGITQENWPAIVGIFTGIFAKEAVIATLNSLYSMEDNSADKDDTFNFWRNIKDAFATIPANISDLTESLLDPLDFKKVDEDINSLQEELEMNTNAITQIEYAFSSSNAAMAYLIFILLYTPCAAALGAIYRETNFSWMLFIAAWTFFVGWISATSFYQFTQLGQSTNASFWLIGLTLLFAVVVLMMKIVGRYISVSQLSVKKSNNQKSNYCC